jgi:hypothetical protein
MDDCRKTPQRRRRCAGARPRGRPCRQPVTANGQIRSLMSWTRSGSHGRSIYGKAQPEASRTERDRGRSSSTPAGRPVARVSENSRLRARGCGGGEGLSRG